MSNELINLNELGIPQPNSKELVEFVQSSDYLPQLRVYGSESGVVKEGNFPMGHIGLYYSTDKVIDLGTQVDVLVITNRPRTSIMTGGEQPISFFTQGEANFEEVKSKALQKQQGYMVGLEYLLWIPSVEKFAMFFMGNPTLRRESANVLALQGQAATLKIKLIKTKSYTWHGVECFKCDTPFDIPSVETIKETYEKYFANPKDSPVNVTGTSTEDRAR